MNKWKKAYCIASFVFAVCVCAFTITYMFANPTVVYATQVDDTTQSGDGEADYRDDGADGVSGIHITVDTDSEEGTMSAPIKIFIFTSYKIFFFSTLAVHLAKSLVCFLPGTVGLNFSP